MIDSDADRLVQRFVDHELSAEERVRFIARLGREESLRERLVALERLAFEAGRLPRPVVPDGFVSRVMEKTEPRPSGGRLLAALWTPHVLRWNLAGALAVGCAAALVIGGVVSMLLRQAGATQPPDSTASSQAGAPPARVLVRLLIVQPGARTVQAAGDFNGWDPARTPLEQVSDGAWAVTIPLEPGRYEYMYVIDGREWIVDPFAVEQSDDGFGSRNAVLDVSAAGDAL